MRWCGKRCRKTKRELKVESRKRKLKVESGELKVDSGKGILRLFHFQLSTFNSQLLEVLEYPASVDVKLKEMHT
jgi:hypothetical protein